jgi:hypothetical protein
MAINDTQKTIKAAMSYDMSAVMDRWERRPPAETLRSTSARSNARAVA